MQGVISNRFGVIFCFHALIAVCFFYDICDHLIPIKQVHIVQRGAVRPLIEMLQSPDAQLKEMSAFALGRLAQVYFCPLLS